MDAWGFTSQCRAHPTVRVFLHVETESIAVRHISGQVIAEWQLDALAERFMQKLPGLILVSAFSEMRGDSEWFKFERAQLLIGTSPGIIGNQIQVGNIIFDLRLTTRASSTEAQFVANEENLCWLFREWRDL